MPHKRDARVLGRGPEFDANVPAAEVTKTGYRNRPNQRALATRNRHLSEAPSEVESVVDIAMGVGPWSAIR